MRLQSIIGLNTGFNHVTCIWTFFLLKSSIRRHKIDNKSEVSIVRNDTIHEALFLDEPLGFSIYGGNQSTINNGKIILQMQNLICRLLVAILGEPNTDYVKTGIESRMYQSLKFNTFSK